VAERLEVYRLVCLVEVAQSGKSPRQGSRLCAQLFFVPSVDIGGALTIHMVLIRAENLSL